ncbi:glycosyltransferase [Mucilaginibacter calamicampi]|uniref:Glycosyltransferase n=1 Tax=Mucilaginibacter calamicampi TaxID=1302352 RepID=A0ABW2YU28_9SPHI
MLDLYLRVTLLGIFLLTFVIQLYYLVAHQRSLATYRPTEELPEAKLPVSVIISARNEVKNLRENLPPILEQDYPNFEVIVVNDCSSDDSDLLLQELQQTYPHLKVVTKTEHIRFKTGKKFALTLGIKAATHEHLLFTDADCSPSSKNWITYMAGKFEHPQTQIVLGYSPYIETKNFLNSIIRFETLKTAINYLSAALNGNAYMGIGRNLAYTKSLFFASKGFAAHMHVLSGDDDLFVNQNATSANTAIEIHPDAFMYTPAKASLGGLFRQKKRHMGAGKLYRGKHRRMLSAEALSGLVFYVVFIACLVLNIEPLWVLGVFIMRWVLQLIIYSKIFKKLAAGAQLWYLPLIDFVYYIYVSVFGLIGALVKTRQWK